MYINVHMYTRVHLYTYVCVHVWMGNCVYISVRVRVPVAVLWRGYNEL